MLIVVGLIFVAITVALFLSRKAGSIEVDVTKGTLKGKAKGRGTTVRDARSRKGGINANDDTGVGVDVERVDVEGDINAGTNRSDPKQ